MSNGKFYITIKEELEITEAYLHIMQVRYFNKFDYYIHCPRSLYEYPCLKLLLQPIVENSIYHGIKELEYKGILEIMVTEFTDAIRIVVQDNGIGFSKEAYDQIWQTGSDHFGIKNIHQRIQLYYGTEYGLKSPIALREAVSQQLQLERRPQIKMALNLLIADDEYFIRQRLKK